MLPFTRCSDLSRCYCLVCWGVSSALCCVVCFKQRISVFHCVEEVLSQLCWPRLVQSITPKTVWLQPKTLSSLPPPVALLGTQPYLSGYAVAVFPLDHKFHTRKSNSGQIHHLQVSSDLADQNTALSLTMNDRRPRATLKLKIPWLKKCYKSSGN